jgi:hypothetical protein
MCQPEPSYRLPAPVLKDVPDNTKTFGSPEVKVSPVQAGSREGIRREPGPECIRAFAPDHVCIDEQAPVERHETMQVVLEADDGSVGFRERLDVLKERIEPITFQFYTMSFRAEKHHRPRGVMTTKRHDRCDRVANVFLGPVRVEDVSF